jgi:hypothetical protein
MQSVYPTKIGYWVRVSNQEIKGSSPSKLDFFIGETVFYFDRQKIWFNQGK